MKNKKESIYLFFCFGEFDSEMFTFSRRIPFKIINV